MTRTVILAHSPDLTRVASRRLTRGRATYLINERLVVIGWFFLVPVTGEQTMTLVNGERPQTDEDVSWFPCPACGDLLYAKRWHRNGGVCPECGAHGRLDARDRIAQLVDAGSFREL